MSERICPHCGNPTEVAVRVSVHGMYDTHLFHRVEANSIKGVIEAWEEHNASPNPAIVGGVEVDDLGPSALCPVDVMTADRESIRRVGTMVFPGSPRYADQLESWRSAVEADPDIRRLLAKQEGEPNG